MKTSTKIEQELRNPPYLNISCSGDGGLGEGSIVHRPPRARTPISARGNILSFTILLNHLILHWMPLIVETMFSLKQVRVGHALQLCQNNVLEVVPIMFLGLCQALCSVMPRSQLWRSVSGFVYETSLTKTGDKHHTSHITHRGVYRVALQLKIHFDNCITNENQC